MAISSLHTTWSAQRSMTRLSSSPSEEAAETFEWLLFRDPRRDIVKSTDGMLRDILCRLAPEPFDSLTNSSLTGFFLTGSFLTGSFLTGSFLTGSFLTDSFLTGSFLAGSFLTYSSLTLTLLDTMEVSSSVVSTGSGFFPLPLDAFLLMPDI